MLKFFILTVGVVNGLLGSSGLSVTWQCLQFYVVNKMYSTITAVVLNFNWIDTIKMYKTVNKRTNKWISGCFGRSETVSTPKLEKTNKKQQNCNRARKIDWNKRRRQPQLLEARNKIENNRHTKTNLSDII